MLLKTEEVGINALNDLNKLLTVCVVLNGGLGAVCARWLLRLGTHQIGVKFP
jgi:hypothetical protein